MSHQENTYEFCGRFFAALEGQGVRHVVASPGSRSTPLVVSARLSGLKTWMHLDERSAGFFALGLALRTGQPTVLVCTSGTAAANYLPAVIEANHSGVPLVVCTADRPPELRQWGAGQTVDQLKMYGNNVRWFAELPVGSEAPPELGTTLAVRAAEQARTGRGPVHLNWPFRKPLEPPEGWSAQGHWPRPQPLAGPAKDLGAAGSALASMDGGRGVIVAGPGAISSVEAAAISRFAAAAGWPILAGPASQMRRGAHVADALIVGTADLLLGTPSFVQRVGAADVVVHVGGAPVTKSLHQWLAQHPPATTVLVNPGTDWVDPATSVSHVVRGPVAEVFALAPTTTDPSWTRLWTDADAAVAALPLPAGFTELHVAASLGEALPAGSVVMASNSMPIRDLDLALRTAPDPLTVVANRGASGIDGITSTALGLAAADESAAPIVLFTGDVALLHDLGGLLAVNRFGQKLVVVLVDNDGGGIFAFLPIATGEDDVHYNELFHTPHGTDFAQVAALAGFHYEAIEQADANSEAGATAAGTFTQLLTDALARPESTLIRARAPADANRAAFAQLRAAAADALSP